MRRIKVLAELDKNMGLMVLKRLVVLAVSAVIAVSCGGDNGGGAGPVSLYVSSDETNSVLAYDGTTGAFVGEFVTADSGGLAMPTFITFGPSPK